MQREEKCCEVCEQPSTKRCSRCQVAYYCSEEHQKLNWKDHSKNCEPCRLVKNSGIGRHFVATRNIAVGEVVLCDKVLIMGPHYARVFKTNGEMMERSTRPVCLGCYSDLTVDNAVSCKSCGWPLCFRCKKHGIECYFTSKYRKSKVTITNYETSHMAYEAIAVIRGLALRDCNPKAYQRLLNLRDQSPNLETLSKIYAAPKEVARFVKSFFDNLDIEEELIIKIYKIQLINMYVLSTTKPPHFAVYDRSSWMENNCRANISRSYTPDGGVIIWAAVPISKGDHITCCYPNFRWTTEKRRKDLSITKSINCTCSRCSDPTEFGLMLSAYKCFKTEGCSGHMLPPTFLVAGTKLPDYVCDKCNVKVPWVAIRTLEGEIEEHWQSLDKRDFTQCHTFLTTWKRVLHENHYYNFDVELEMLHVTGNRGHLEAQPNGYLEGVMKCCKKMLNIITILAPAQHVLRGSLMYLKAAAATTLFDRIQPKPLDQTYAHIQETKFVLQEVRVLLHRETSASVDILLEQVLIEEAHLKEAEQQIQSCVAGSPA